MSYPVTRWWRNKKELAFAGEQLDKYGIPWRWEEDVRREGEQRKHKGKGVYGCATHTCYRIVRDDLKRILVRDNVPILIDVPLQRPDTTTT